MHLLKAQNLAVQSRLYSQDWKHMDIPGKQEIIKSTQSFSHTLQGQSTGWMSLGEVPSLPTSQHTPLGSLQSHPSCRAPLCSTTSHVPQPTPRTGGRQDAAAAIPRVPGTPRPWVQQSAPSQVEGAHSQQSPHLTLAKRSCRGALHRHLHTQLRYTLITAQRCPGCSTFIGWLWLYSKKDLGIYPTSNSFFPSFLLLLGVSTSDYKGSL